MALWDYKHDFIHKYVNLQKFQSDVLNRQLLAHGHVEGLNDFLSHIFMYRELISDHKNNF